MAVQESHALQLGAHSSARRSSRARAPDDSWLFQLSEDLVEVNLGDAGTMYVFTDRAYWDGH